MRHLRFACAALLALAASSAAALSYVPISDEALLQQADAVVFGEIGTPYPVALDGGPSTDYPVQVVETYRGQIPAGTLIVSLPGDDRTRVIAGVVRFAAGNRAVLFLTRRADGRFGLTQLNLGAFLLVERAEQQLLRRPLDGLTRISGSPPDLKAMNEGLRDADAFRGWLIGQSVDSSLLPGPFPEPAGSPATQKYQLLADPVRGPGRWFAFDLGTTVGFRASSAAQQGLAGGGYTQFQQGLAAWTNDTNSNIRYAYEGTTTASAGLASADGINSILFNDPNGEVDGTFDCRGGGVLALGGYVTSGSADYRGNNFNIIVEADIVTNDNTGCYFSLRNGSNGAEIFTHELGHTLGLGHSCGDSTVLILDDCILAPADVNDATMRAFPHGDGRGAQLRSDDQDGVAALYGAGTVNPDNGGLLGIVFELLGSEGPVGVIVPGTGGSAGGGTPVGDAPNTSSGGGGGGCSFVPTARSGDLSLLLLLGAAFITRRRRGTHSR